MWREFTELLLISGDMALNLFVSLILSFLISLGIAMLYRSTHRGLNYEHSFVNTLVLLAPIVTLVMLFIRGDLVLSLGLVGSLSIIRFRTPIKDSRDMVYIFWVIAVGLGCGTNNWTLVLISTLLLAIVVSLLYLFEYGRPHHTDFVMVISGTSHFLPTDAETIIKQHTMMAHMRSHEINDEHWEIIFELRFSRTQEKNATNMLQEIQALAGVTRVSLLAPQLALPI
ncbi:MAG TPA: DUF4956 domain-containing protein [Oscillospiraceae bacterium]|nr:DUF4956 domain-containing protein [Oscillospiraceae bacterium]